MTDVLVHLLREGFMLAALLSTPPLLASWVAQLGAAFALRAAGIPEAAGMSHAPQLLAAAAAVAVAAPWTIEQLVNFTRVVFVSIGEVAP